MEKFGITYKRGVRGDDAILAAITKSFIEALQWTMLYYYRGVPSWGWFYPVHYAPMVSDLVGLRDLGPISFKLGRPFLPFQQLLGCLPAASANFLPAPYRELMTSSTSPLAEFYPPLDSIRSEFFGGREGQWER